MSNWLLWLLLTWLTGSPLTAFVVHSPLSTTARMKSSGTRTLLFEFWKNTDE